jgi:putative membrane protein
MYWNGSGWWGMWLVMGAFWILILLLIIAAFYWLFKANQGPGTRARPPGESPEEIVKKRYARGEIDEEEYHRRLEELRR